MHADPLLDIAAVADRLGTTERHVRRMTESRSLPYFKIGAKVRFEANDVDTWIQNQRIEAIAG